MIAAPVTYPRGEQGDRHLAIRIREIHAAQPAYGSRRVHDVLRAARVNVSRKRVIRLMGEREIHGAAERRKPEITIVYADRLVSRGSVPRALDRVWVGDTTQFQTREGWLYLTVWIDLRSKVLVGWAMSPRNDTDIALAALNDAIKWRCPASGLIVHSDRGCQFSSADFRAALDANGFQASMSRRGNCHDNASSESFFAVLKRETRIRTMKGEARDTVRATIAHYLMSYNGARIHTARECAPLAFEALPPAEQDAILARTAERAATLAAKRAAKHAARRAAERDGAERRAAEQN